MKRHPLPRAGFTLIELLIVVAIIAILAAIAVPNFLEAQTRAKVSRAQADMRSVATALESYRVDYNLYPWPGGSPGIWEFPYGGSYVVGFSQTVMLTTPVAYLTSLPPDPFQDRVGEIGTIADSYYNNSVNVGSYVYQRHRENMRIGMPYSAQAQTAIWGMYSFGPDRNSLSNNLNHPYDYHLYDPTNGTLSSGNIWRFGP